MGQSVKKNQYINNAHWINGYAACLTGANVNELLRRFHAIEDQLREASDHIDEDGSFIEED